MTGDVESSAVVSQADVVRRAGLHLQLAIGYYEQGQFAVAVEEASLAVRGMPDMGDAYSVRALAYMALAQWSQAESDFRRALALAPDNPDFANNYAWFLCSGAGESVRYVEAMHYFEQALSESAFRSPGTALANAGTCSLRAGDVEAAERYFLRGFQQAPSSAAINVNLGKFYFGRAEFEKARVHIGLAAKNDVLAADVLWLAIKIERKLGNQAAESELAVQLRRRYPSSSEYAAYRRGVFDE